MTVCVLAACMKPRFGRGLCQAHYARWSKTGLVFRLCRGCDMPLPDHLGRTIDYYCTPECRFGTAVCEHCGQTFVRNKRMLPENRGKFCSQKCQWNGIAARQTDEEREAKKRHHQHLSKRRRRARQYGVGHEPYSRQAVYDRDGGDCQLCGEHIDLSISYPDPMYFSIDHVIPLSKGGHDHFDNVQSAHMICNQEKKDRLLEHGARAVIRGTESDLGPAQG